MRLKTLSFGLLFASLFVGSIALAEGPRQEEEHARPAMRAPPPKFQPHANGIHPRGATVRPHAVRVLSSKVIVHGNGGWAHWGHPEFVRPAYYWDWSTIRSVSCTAEDSYGDQYPVTETAGGGFGINNMTNVEDDALDRCYSESGGDTSCVLATCSHF